MHKSLNENKTK